MLFVDSSNHDVADILSSKDFPIPSPTILFAKPAHLEGLVTSISKQAKKSWLLYPFARRHKLANLTEGYITKESLWDRLVFDSARAKVIGDGAGTLRAVIVSGGEHYLVSFHSGKTYHCSCFRRSRQRLLVNPFKNISINTFGQCVRAPACSGARSGLPSS